MSSMPLTKQSIRGFRQKVESPDGGDYLAPKRQKVTSYFHGVTF